MVLSGDSKSKPSSVNVEEGSFPKQELPSHTAKFSFTVVAVSAVTMLALSATLASFGQVIPPADAEKAPAQVMKPAVAPPALSTEVPAPSGAIVTPAVVQELADFKPT